MTRRQRSNNSFVIGDGGEFGARTPTEQRATKTITPTTEVKIPRTQAFWTTLPWAISVGVTALFPIVVGEHVFFVATACGAIAAFFWALRNETTWLSMICFPFVPGVGGLCIWKFYELVGTRAYIVTVVSGSFVLFWWLFSSASTLTFVQRLGMPMFPQQYLIWSALGSVLEWKLKREPPAPTIDPLIFNRSRRYAAPELQEREPEPVEELTELQLFVMLAGELGTLTRDDLAGKHLANGKKLSKPAWARCVEQLRDQGFVENGGSGYGWTLGQSADTALDAFV